MDDHPNPILADLEPALDELDSADRDPLVLRFFENRSLREVFGRRGATVSSAALLTALGLTANAAVPAGLSSAITTAVFGAAATTTLAMTTMNWISIKSICAIGTAVALAGAGTYFVQRGQVEQLRREQQSLSETNLALLAQLRSAQESARSSEEQLNNSRQNATELLRLRNEVGQLRRQVAEAKASQAATQAQASEKAPASHSRSYEFARDRLANLGYDTPEAALATAAWAAIQGGHDAIRETLSPELLTNKEATAVYNRNQKAMGQLLKSITMLSKKALSDTEVQIKVEYDLDNGNGTAFKQYAITPMMKGAAGWKLGVTRDYSENWEQDGVIETLGGN